MPQTREIPISRGQRCWIALDYPAGVGPRLRPGSIALVLNPTARDGLVEIECDGRRWVVAPTTIDCGTEYLMAAGEWITEGDPIFRDWAFRELREIRATGSRLPVDVERIRELAHQLDRNGWTVPRWCEKHLRLRRR